MAFARGTTPTITFTLDDDDLDLTLAKNVYVTFKYGNKTVTKSTVKNELEISANTITVTLTQQETLDFGESKVEVQVNWTYNNGIRWSTDCASYRVSKQLLDEVVD